MAIVTVMIYGELQPITVEAAGEQERRRLVERVLASEALSRSGRLSEFLRFVCDLTLAGRAAEINEQRVGEAVFGRLKDYDSSIDGIVRTQASRLRQRLSLYFEKEGRNEPLVIMIPRGSYVPVFEYRQQPTLPTVSIPGESANTAEQVEPAPHVVYEPPRRSNWLPWILVAVLACACAVLAIHEIPPFVQPATLADSLFWSKLFVPGQSTLLVPGDSSLVNYQNLVHRSVNLAEYVNGDYRNGRPEEVNSVENVAARLSRPRYTSLVDLEIAQALSIIAREQHGNLELRHPREARPNDFKQGDLILVGSPESTPWVSLFEPDMNFVFDYRRTPEKVVISVINRRPQASEPPQWTSAPSNPQHPVYAVVAYLRNLTGTGNVLILEGITMAGTECAWDFVSDQNRLNSFLNRVRRPDGRIPHFEVVLGTDNLNGGAGEASILATRVSDP
jgi:hypothetical protein